MLDGLRLYISRQSSSLKLYCLEQLIMLLFGWIPTVVGIGIRAFAYRIILQIDTIAAIENHVRIRFADQISLGKNAYIDQNVYLHACKQGIAVGNDTFIMHGAVLHVYNFRELPHAFIRIGNNSLIGELNVLRGQGGISIGDRVYTGPLVQILAVNHVYDNPNVPMVEQGITAEGITIEDDVWIGAGAIIGDGVTIGCASVVAAGAVVTKDVPARTVVAGVPAKVVRSIGESVSQQDVVEQLATNGNAAVAGTAKSDGVGSSAVELTSSSSMAVGNGLPQVDKHNRRIYY